MKLILKLLLGVGLLLFVTSCSNMKSSNEKGQEVAGTVAEQGITSYQYGTHTLNSEDQFYALTSDAVDLDALVGQRVVLIVEKVEGYPVDGGPEYLRVTEVKE